MFVFGGNTDDGYKIERSLRFNSADSAYLNRTPAAASNRKTWTWSGWVKRSNLGSLQVIFSSDAAADVNNWCTFTFNTDDTIYYDVSWTAAINRIILKSTQVFRDPSAWYHFVFSVDTTKATAADRIIIYVNGQRVNLTTYAIGSGYVPQNTDLTVNSTSYVHTIGRRNAGTGGNPDGYINSYLTEVHFIDGAALGPEHFGETDVATGVWKPKKYEVEIPIDFLVIGGGGGGAGNANNSGGGGGGGGAGGYREVTGLSFDKNIAYALTVGAGGNGGVGVGAASTGSSSTFSSIVSAGGGAGAYDRNGENGGSGGGARYGGTVGLGNTPATSPSQGSNGGTGSNAALNGGGGGGGAGAVGGNGAGGASSANAVGGNGGAGVASFLTGASVTRAGGGGGGTYATAVGAVAGTGGSGGGGNGATNGNGSSGTVNTGGGGGASGRYTANAYNGGNGGSGTVILRYPSNFTATFSAGVTQTTTTTGTTKVSVVTVAGPTDTVTFS